MLDGTEDTLLTLCQRGVDAALAHGATQAEVYAQRGRTTKVGFQKNDLDSVSVGEETVFGIRVLLDGRLGFATANHEGSLDEVAAEAVHIARASPPDEAEHLAEPRPVPRQEPLVDPALLALDPTALARMGNDLLQEVLGQRRADLPDARVTVDTLELSLHHEARAVASSTGVAAAHRSAWAQGGVFGMAVDGDEVGSFSYDGDAVRHAEDLQPGLARTFARFARKSLGALGAHKGESFRGPCFIPADVVEDFLLGHLVGTLCADAVRKGTSPFADLMGERIAVPGFTLVEEGPGLPGYPITSFDREGLPRQRMPLVEDGVLRSFLFDASEAARVGRSSTGHAQGGASSLPKVGPTCFSLAPGDGDADLLDRMQRGVIITRFSGSTEVSSGDFSGVVKGGFLVRNGERIPIRETTVAGNLWKALKSISAITRQTETFYGVRSLPGLVIDDLSITAG